MKKKNYNFEEFKEILKEDIDEGVFFFIILPLEVYLIVISKMVLAVVTLMIFTLTLIIYRKYFKKIRPKQITTKNKEYYELLGKLLYVSILLSFFIVYGTNLFQMIKSSREMSVALFYPRLILLIAIIFLLLWSFYLLKKWTFKRELFFSIISLIVIYETFILFVVYDVYKIKPSDSDVGFYLMTLFIAILCLWMIYSYAKFGKNDKTKLKISPKK